MEVFMDAQNVNLNVNSIDLLSPVVAAQLVNAYYTALLLKARSGADITPEIEQEVWRNVIRRWSDVMPAIRGSINPLFTEKPPRPPRTNPTMSSVAKRRQSQRMQWPNQRN